MKENEQYILYKYIKSENSIFATMVLRMMDTEEFLDNYYGSLKLVCKLFPEIEVNELEKELDKIFILKYYEQR